MDVRMPDGAIIRGVPEGTPKDEIYRRYLRTQIDKQQAEGRQKHYESMSPLGKFAMGVGGQALGRIKSVGNMAGLVSDDEMAQHRQMYEQYTGRGIGKAGSFAGDVALGSLTGGSMAGMVAGGAALGVTDPNAKNLRERATGATIGAGLGYVGGKLGNWANKTIANRMKAAATRRAQDAGKLDLLRRGQALDLRVPPATSNPTTMNRMLESTAGKEAMQQAASVHNAQRFQDIARDYLKLPKAAPLTQKTLDDIRSANAPVYREVTEAIDDVGGLAAQGTKYVDRLNDIQKRLGGTHRLKIIGQHREIRGMIKELKRLPFDGNEAMQLVSGLRKEAGASFAARKPALGKAQREAADAVEELIEDNISRIGLGGVGKDYARQLVTRWRGARVMDAKTHLVERVFNKATGNVKGAKIAKELSKGAPMDKNMKTFAEWASAFERTTKDPTHSPGVNALTTLFAAEGALLGHPETLAIPIGRLGMGAAMMSKAGQGLAVPSYKAGTKLPRVAQGLGRAAAPAYFSIDEDEGQ